MSASAFFDFAADQTILRDEMLNILFAGRDTVRFLFWFFDRIDQFVSGLDCKHHHLRRVHAC